MGHRLLCYVIGYYGVSSVTKVFRRLLRWVISYYIRRLSPCLKKLMKAAKPGWAKPGAGQEQGRSRPGAKQDQGRNISRAGVGQEQGKSRAEQNKAGQELGRSY